MARRSPGRGRLSPQRRLQLSASYALLFGEELLPVPGGGSRTVNLSKVARHKVLAGLTVRPFWRVVADVRLRWVGDVQTLPSNSAFRGGTMPGYYDINLNVRVEDIVRGLDAHLLIQNLTDARYYQPGVFAESVGSLPRVPQPGLRFLAGLTYRY